MTREEAKKIVDNMKDGDEISFICDRSPEHVSTIRYTKRENGFYRHILLTQPYDHLRPDHLMQLYKLGYVRNGG